MEKQFWVLCKNTKEENELLELIKGYKVDIKSCADKSSFPIIVDKDKKLAFRCTSASFCGAFVASGNKILNLKEFKKIYEE